MINFIEDLQKAVYKALVQCNGKQSDMFLKKHEKEQYKKQYNELLELQTIISDTYTKVNKIN